MADSGIVINISGDPEDFEKAVKQVRKLFQQSADDAKGFGQIASGAISSFIGNLASTAVSSGFAAIKSGFGSLIDLTKESVKEALEGEQAQQKLNIALANSGKFTADAASSFGKFADSLSATTGVQDDVIIKSGALLQSLGQLDQQGLQRATAAAADLSAAIGVDLESAASILGKAAQGNVEALKRYGIQIEDTGDKTRDFANALSAIEGRFGGTAKALNDTFSGALTGAQNSFANLQETFGETITSSPALKGAIQGVGAIFGLLEKTIEDNKEAILDFVDSGVNIFISGIGYAGEAVVGFIELKNGFEAFFSFIDDGIGAIVESFFEFGAGLAESKAKIQEFFGVSSDASRQAAADFRAQATAVKEARDEQLTEVNEGIKANEQKIESIRAFTSEAQRLVQERVDAARAAGEQENGAFFEQQSAKAAIKAQFDQAEKDALLTKIAETEQAAIDTLGRVEAEELAAQQRKLVNEGQYTEAKRAIAKEREKIDQNSIFAIQKYEELTQKQRLQNLQSTLGSIATLQSNATGELFAVGKAAAVATATIDGIAAVQKALASAPPPFNFALAALVGVATAANIAKIASAEPPKVTGAFDGGLVTGGSASSDSSPFLLSKGEVVAPARNFDEVVEGTARQRGMVTGDENAETNRLLAQISSKLDQVGGDTYVVNGDVLADDLFINRLAEKLRDAVQFRGAVLS